MLTGRWVGVILLGADEETQDGKIFEVIVVIDEKPGGIAEWIPRPALQLDRISRRANLGKFTNLQPMIGTGQY
jgi:hypothetical protein